MRSLRALIGADCAERIWITSHWEAWLDENGSAAGKPVNRAASLLAQSYGWQVSLLGTAVIVGLDKDADNPAELSQAQVDAIIRKVSCPTSALPRRRGSTNARREPPGEPARNPRAPCVHHTCCTPSHYHT
jgi:hypothetical protein